MERRINAPSRDLLTKEQACEWMGITKYVFDLLIERKVMPNGIAVSSRENRWHWMDVVSVAHLLSRGVVDLSNESGQEE